MTSGFIGEAEGTPPQKEGICALIVDPVLPDGDVFASSRFLGNHSLDHLRYEVLPRLTIFNAANEKDAFAASLPKSQDVATVDVGYLSRRGQRR